KKHYDVAVDLQGNARSVALSLLAKAGRSTRYRPERLKRFMLVHFGKDLYSECLPVPLKYAKAVRLLRMQDDGLGLDFFVSPGAKQGLAKAAAKIGFPSEGRLIVLAPGAGRRTKRWPEEHYADLGNHFSRKGFRVALIGGKQDQKTCLAVREQMQFPAYDFSGLLSLQESAALMQKAAVAITNDTGMMHVACGLGVPVAALFGPTSRHFGFMPFRAASRVLELPLKCRPCSNHGSARCPKSHFGCMNGITAREVIRAAEDLIQERL
ncbi:glycosyltransferase family 9 protein, partial [bacterium]|nr:glycosyltransferase family 9 protein [bacterium]